MRIMAALARNRRSVALSAAGVLGVLALVAFRVYLLPLLHIAEPGFQGKSSAKLSLVRHLHKHITKDSTVTLVRFSSDLETHHVTRGNATKCTTELWPRTRFDRKGITDGGVLEVRGTFTVLRNCNLPNTAREPIPWGRVVQSVPVSDERMRRENAASTRLWPFIDERHGSFPQIGPVTLLAIHPATSNAPLDAHFIGPLHSADVAGLPALATMLQSGSYDRAQVTEAGRLLASRNPWLVCAGLDRLASLDRLTIRDFGVATSSRSEEDVRLVAEDLFSAIQKQPAMGEWSEHLLMKDVAPHRQQRYFKVLRQYLESKVLRSPPVVDLRRLQDAARAYRQELSGDPEREKLMLPELDALLTIQWDEAAPGAGPGLP